MSVRWRLTLWYTLVLMFAMIVFAATIFVAGSWQLRNATDRELQQTARQLTAPLLAGEEPVAIAISYRVLSPQGLIIRTSGLPARRVPVDPAAVNAALQGRTWLESIRTPLISADETTAAARRPSLLAPTVRVLTIPLGKPTRLILQVGKAETDVPKLRSLLLIALAVGLMLGLPLAGLGGWWLAGRALAPVRGMIETANRIEAEHLTQRLPQPAQHDELGALARTLNQLLDRLQAAFERERRFTADVSHDLRTPLALMKSSVGVALNRPRSVAELQSTLTTVDNQIDRLSGLLDAALTIGRADSGELAERFAPLDLSELLADLSETTAGYCEERFDLALTCDLAPDLWIKGDRDALTRVFLNLLDNAMQHTPVGGAIRLAASSQSGQAVVAVEDNGMGIAPEDLPHIFDRFYRSDKARTHSGQTHYGLGLSIAQAIVRAHGGAIAAQSTPGKGSRFTVSLPQLIRTDAQPLS